MITSVNHDLTVIECCTCAVTFALPAALVTRARQDGRALFYCPNGHPQGFRKSEADMLREQLATAEGRAVKAEREAAEALRAAREGAEALRLAERKATKPPTRRVGAGKCPHCGRSCKGLLSHIRLAHPDKVAADA